MRLQLQQYGIGAQLAAKIARRYGAETLRVVRENPYRLIEDIPEISFEDADKLAERFGITALADKRIQAGLFATLHRHSNKGHCAAPEHDLTAETAKHLGLECSPVCDQLTVLVHQRRVIREQFAERTLIYLPRFHAAEMGVIAHLERLMNAPPPWKRFDVDAAIQAARIQSAIPLDDSQIQATRAMLRHKVCAMEGDPGTGKTTQTGFYVSVLEQHIRIINLCSPTARAARQLSGSTGLSAQTVHRLLGCGRDGRFRFNASRRLNVDVVVLDESSMVDIELLLALLEALPDHCALVFVGDPNQLLSVAPGQPFRDLLDHIPTVRLTKPHRQEENSRLYINIHRVKECLPPLMATERQEKFQWHMLPNSPAIADKVVDLVCRELPLRFGYPALSDIQVLTPMHGGELGTVRLNQQLQQRLNPLRAGEEHLRIVLPDAELRVRDRVMQQVNDYTRDVYNGDTGYVEHIARDKRYVIVNFYGRQIRYPFEELDDLRLAYAITVHKTQGNEFPVVVMPLSLDHDALLNKYLLFTGMSRAIERLELVTDEKAIEAALSSRNNEPRVTGLSEMAQRLMDRRRAYAA